MISSLSTLQSTTLAGRRSLTLLHDPGERRDCCRAERPLRLLTLFGKVADSAQECFTDHMRKALSILLLAIFGLPVFAPLLTGSADGDQSVPACCRRNGKHHCLMGAAERSLLTQRSPALKSLAERCTYCPGCTASSQHDGLALFLPQAKFASLTGDAARVAEGECNWRTAQIRCRQKRGPPTILL